MKKGTRIASLVLITLLVVVGVVFSVIRFPLPNSYNIFKGFASGINLGKDFDGGVLTIYESSSEINSDDLKDLIDIIGKDANVIEQSENKIIIDVPNSHDPATVLTYIGENSAFKICTSSTIEDPVVDATGLKSAEYFLNGSTNGVLLTFTDEAQALMEGLDYSSNDNPYAIYIGSTAVVQLSSSMAGGVGFLSAGTKAEAEDLADRIMAGKYTKDLTQISSESYEATFGEDAFLYVQIGYAVAIALLIVLLCIMYKMLGVWASISTLFYSVATLIIFSLAEIEFNSASIVALVVGYMFFIFSHTFMFENFKKEYRNGKKVSTSIKQGFKKSYPIILDIAVLTIICSIAPVCFTSVLKNFASTLMITTILGVVCTLGLTYGMIDIYLPFATSKPKKLLSFKREVKNDEIK